MSFLLAAVLATAPAPAPACSWNQPGHRPFMGDVVAAVDRYRDIPAPVRAKLKQRMAVRAYDEVVSIGRDAITGRARYGAQIRDMHFGEGQVCATVDRSAWRATDQERGLVYCEDGHCILVPTVCRNVSRISREAPAQAAGGEGAGVAGLGAGGGQAGGGAGDGPAGGGVAAGAGAGQGLEVPAVAGARAETDFGGAPTAGPLQAGGLPGTESAGAGRLPGPGGPSFAEAAAPAGGLGDPVGGPVSFGSVPSGGDGDLPSSGPIGGAPTVSPLGNLSGSDRLPTASGGGPLPSLPAPTPPVPEPAGWAMLLAGLAGLGWLRRRRG